MGDLVLALYLYVRIPLHLLQTDHWLIKLLYATILQNGLAVTLREQLLENLVGILQGLSLGK